MRLTRVFVDQQVASGAVIELPAEAGAHVARVLRARPGDALTLFDGGGTEFSSHIETLRGNRVRVLVGAEKRADRESPLRVTLVQCVPRGDRMDIIVQKATELGIAAIVPVLSQRGVVRLDGTQAESKCAHWRRVAVSACEQCGRNRLPPIATPRRLIDYLGEPSNFALRMVLDPDTRGEAAPASITGEVEVLIGPEGGFAAEELEAFRMLAFHRLALGPRILRTETAAIGAVVWLQTAYGDMRPNYAPNGAVTA
jgi:16S rRNA (uracil1498-N3)-methyltransferase